MLKTVSETLDWKVIGSPGREIVFTFRTAMLSGIEIDILSATGRVVRSLAPASLPAGILVRWDGRDELGAPCASGLYWAR